MGSDYVFPRTANEEIKAYASASTWGFALAAASRYYVLEAGRITSSGEGGADALDRVRAAMAI